MNAGFFILIWDIHLLSWLQLKKIEYLITRSARCLFLSTYNNSDDDADDDDDDDDDDEDDNNNNNNNNDHNNNNNNNINNMMLAKMK